GEARQHVAIQVRAFDEKSLVGLLVVQVRQQLLPGKESREPLQTFVLQDADFVVQVLFQASHLGGFDGSSPFVLIRAFAREDLHIHHDALDTRGASQGSIADVAGLFAEDGAQKLFLRSELSFTLGGNLADQNIAGLYVSSNADNATLVQVHQQGFRNIRDVTRDFFRTQLGVTRFDFELLDMNRGIGILFYELLADQDGVFKVVTSPGHEGHEYVTPQGQLPMVGTGTVGEDLSCQNTLVFVDRRLLVDAGVLVGATELGQLVDVGTDFPRELPAVAVALDAHNDALAVDAVYDAVAPANNHRA